MTKHRLHVVVRPVVRDVPHQKNVGTLNWVGFEEVVCYVQKVKIVRAQ